LRLLTSDGYYTRSTFDGSYKLLANHSENLYYIPLMHTSPSKTSAQDGGEGQNGAECALK